MKTKARTITGQTACLLGALLLLGLTVAKPASAEEPLAELPAAPRERIAAIQARLNESKELDVEMKLRTAFHKSGTLSVAMRTPTAFVIDEAAVGDNPRCLSWLNDSHLGICEVFPDGRARGVLVDGLPGLAKKHGQDVVFRKCLDKPGFAPCTSLALDLLRLARTAPPDKFQIEKAEGGWRMSMGLKELQDEKIDVDDFLPLDGTKRILVVGVPSQAGAALLTSVELLYEGIPASAAESVTFSRLRTKLADGQLAVPMVRAPLNRAKVSELKELGTTLIDSIRYSRTNDR